MKNSPDQIFVVSMSGVFLAIHQGRERTYHLDYDYMIGKHYSELYSPQFTAQIDAILAKVLSENLPQRVTYSIKVADMYAHLNPEDLDQEYWYEAKVIPVAATERCDPLLLWWTRDITAKVLLEEQIKKLIDYDELTGMYNRRKLLNSMDENFSLFKRYQANTCVIMLDIDDFKQVNDTFGHSVGDKVIKHVADIFSQNIRECDSLGRLGGEEFGVILPNTGIDQAHQLAKRLQRNVAGHVCAIDADNSITVTVSIGVSEFLPNDSDASLALNRADEAMYLSKNSGKNRVSVFEP